MAKRQQQNASGSQVEPEGSAMSESDQDSPQGEFLTEADEAPATDAAEQSTDDIADAGADPEPASVRPMRLEAPHAYYTDDGQLKSWAQDQIVHDPDEIAHLMERGAFLVPHEVQQ